MSHIAIVGAGFIGRSWSIVFARACSSVASVALATNGVTGTCTVTGQDSKTAAFTGIGAGI